MAVGLITEPQQAEDILAQGQADMIAMARGLTMPVDERRQRWSAMMAPLRTNTLAAWRDSFLTVLADAPFGAPQ